MTPFNRVAAVTARDDDLECRRPDGSATSIAWRDVQRVAVRTTDAGPFDDDVFFVIEASSGTYVIPQTADGCGLLLERLQRLPGFDNEAVIEAMSCTENAEFLCWQREN